MSEVVIHNGQVISGGESVPEGLTPPLLPLTPPAAKPLKSGKPEDTEPEEIARLMAQTISQAIDEKKTPMEIVNRLLTMKGPAGHKLVFTRFDVFQTFAIWSKKLGERG